MPSGCGIFASSRILERDIGYSHGYKVGANEIERIGAKTIVIFSSRKFRMSCLLYCFTLKEELRTAKQFVGGTRNDVTVNNKSGATCNHNKK